MDYLEQVSRTCSCPAIRSVGDSFFSGVSALVFPGVAYRGHPYLENRFERSARADAALAPLVDERPKSDV